ncbi:MAG: GNAT family N-acetyltransferase, partial [Pseudomonadota bacterium]
AEIGDLYVSSRAAGLPFLREVHAPDAMRSWIRDAILPRGATWVARRSDCICGFMTLEAGEIDQLYLRPDMRRLGIGSALVAHAKAESPLGLRLVTFQQNQAARAFYEAHGFVAVAFGDGSKNEEGAPDVFYEWAPLSQ